MNIVPLVALYNEPGTLATGLLMQLRAQFGRAVVLTGHWDRYAYDTAGHPGFTVAGGEATNERSKRDMLLHLAIHEGGVTDDDWLLSVDPDERLVGTETLREVLEAIPAYIPFYPLPRVEPDGRVWFMPNKLFRGTARAYRYLDTHVWFHDVDAVFNLDPILVPTLGNHSPRLLPGWPGLVHLARARAAVGERETFYTEPGPPPSDAVDWQRLWHDTITPDYRGVA